MATEQNSKPQPRRTGLWVAVTGIILLTCIYLLRSVLIAPLAITFAERAIAENLGLQISIGNLGGTYISGLELRNITTVKRLANGPLTDLRIRRLAVTYRPLEGLKGLSAFLAGAAIDLEGARLSVDLTMETGAAEEESTGGFWLPPDLPRVRIQDSSLEVKGPAYETRLNDFSLSADATRPAGTRLQLRASRWSLNHPAMRPVSAGLQAELLYTRESLRIDKLALDNQVLVKSATIGLDRLPDQISFNLSLAPAGGHLDISGLMTAAHLQTEFTGAAIDVSRVSGLMASPAMAVAGHLSLEGRLRLPFERPETLQGGATIQVSGGAVKTAAADHLAFRVTADGKNLKIDDLLLADGANRLKIGSASLPASAAFGGDPALILRSLAADWHLEGTDIPSLLKLAGIQPLQPDASIPSHRLVLSGRMAAGDITIPVGRLDVDNGHIQLKECRIALPTGKRMLDESPLAADLQINLPNLDALEKVFVLPALGGSLQGQVTVSGTLNAPLGSADIVGRSLTFRHWPLGNLSIQAQADAGGLDITSARLERGQDRAVARGKIHIEQRILEDLNIELAVSDLSPYFTELIPLLQPAAPNFPELSGVLEAGARLSGPFERPVGSLNLKTRQLEVAGVALGEATFDLAAGEDMFRVTAGVSRADQRLELGADIRRGQNDAEFVIDLKKAALIRSSVLLALTQETRGRVDGNGRVIFDNLILAGSAGRLSAEGRFDPAGPSDLQITLSDFRSDGWLDLLAADVLRFQGLDAGIRIFGPPDAPSFALEGTLASLGSANVPMAFSGRFNLEYRDKVFSVREFAWQGQKGEEVQVTGTLPLDPFQADIFPAGPVAVSGRIQIGDVRVLDFVLPWAADTGGSIQCDLNLTGTWKHPVGEIHLSAEDLKPPEALQILPPGPYRINGDARINGNRLSLDRLAAQTSAGQLEANGQWDGLPTLEDMVRKDVDPMTGEVDLEGSLTVSDLSWLARQTDGVRRLAGSLEARGRLQGPLKAPRADAVIKLADGEFTPDFDMPPLRALNLEATVTPQSVNLRSLAGEMGGSPFELTGSWQLAAGSAHEADIKLRGQNLLLYRDENLRLRADTDLTLKGPLARLTLAGEVAVTDGRFSKNFGVLEGISAAGASDSGNGLQLFSITEPPLRDMVFDVRITAREPFVVRNNLVRGSVRPDLMLSGTGATPLLVGKVYVESTRLYMPAGRIQLETGLVRFEKTDPDRPRLDLIGTSTMLGYDITAVIDGPYDEPVITLSSVPPLPDEELLMLLLTGQPPKRNGVRSSEAKQSLNVAVFIGRDVISRWFGGDEDDTAGDILDRFDIEVGRGITQQGEETIHSQFRLADDVLLDGDSLYLTGERDYFDYYNGGIKLVFRFR
ncbi:MAG: translocation/assembly module TamB domain-containing protein [Deltaproteobacteria bacterium]|jgi:translocation and assembly module TamB|nr:translocation/assembly module TamB domain-containing protein [Deltaproteobacteria bacterium]